MGNGGERFDLVLHSRGVFYSLNKIDYYLRNIEVTVFIWGTIPPVYRKEEAKIKGKAVYVGASLEK